MQPPNYIALQGSHVTIWIVASVFTMILVLVIAFAFTWPYAITCLLVALTVLDEYMMLRECCCLRNPLFRICPICTASRGIGR